MRKTVVFVCVCAAISAACGHEKGGSISPTSPSNTPPDTSRINVILKLGPAINRGANRYSGTLEGVGGASDLIRNLPVDSGPVQSRGESWSGSWVEVIDFGNSADGIGDQTATPPLFGSTLDHFQFNDMPPVRLVPNPVPRVEFGMRVIWGGQLTPKLDANGQPVKDASGAVVMVAKWTPFDKASIIPNAKNMQIQTANGSKCEFAESPDKFGMIHVKCAAMPY